MSGPCFAPTRGGCLAQAVIVALAISVVVALLI